MPEDDSIDRASLTSNTVAMLREICKDRGLLVSGKKSVLVDRILEDAGIVDDPTESTEEDSWGEEALVIDDDTPDTREKVDEVLSRIGGVVEAEVVEAEVVTKESEESSTTIEPVILGEDDQPSLVISMPTLSSLGNRWKAVVAVLLVTILVGAAATVFLQRSSGFTVSELRFGESMDFQILESSVSINGEEMLSIVRDSSGGILDPACGEFSMEMDGTGTVMVSDGPESGAVETTDSLGRSGFLSAEKIISMDLDVDFEGRTWRDDAETDCGNIRWVMSDNELSIDSTSWVEIENSEVKRTHTSVSFNDVDSVTTNLRAVTYDAGGLGGLAEILPILSFPMTPIELHDFFGDVVIKEGARSSDPDINWDSEWSWEVKKEFRDDTHGLVYPVFLENEQIRKCFGHATIQIYVQSGSAWPVKQMSDILLDKDEQTTGCDFLVSSLSDEILPQGSLSVSTTFSRTDSSSGSKPVDWNRDYTTSPGDGEDRPRTSTKRNWVDSMWDETDIRQFDLEEAVTCLKTSHPSTQATQALDSGGYLWRSSWSKPTGEGEWNMSWVDEDDDSGWLVLRSSPEGCEIIVSGSNDRGAVSWNRDSIPSTQTMSLLEKRILSPDRYPDLSQFIQSGNSWNPEAEVGYRLSVTDDNEILSFLPGDLGDGKVTMTATRNWEENGRNKSLDLAMDAETGEMVLWYLIDQSTG
ncbi:MAG: hypothetical protein DWB89_00080 [Candidatus Poseidoniales archaeon]|nr:MAG: hypothetical protein DWB89_00080 [Candidatus Poseidoniales archaeon]